MNHPIPARTRRSISRRVFDPATDHAARGEVGALVPFAAIAVVAVALRLYQLNTVPLWTDELFTLYYPRAGLAYLWGEGWRAEPTPPLYYTLIAVFQRIAGSEAWAIRLPSVLGSLASVWLAWLLGRELFPKRSAALFGALLLAVAPMNVLFGQEARVYALQGAAIGLALLGFARYLRDGSGLALYAAGASLAMWLHPTSVAPVIAVNAGALVAIVATRRSDPAPRFWRWIAANAVVLVVCLPLVPAIVAPPENGAATAWIPALDRWSLEAVIGQTLTGPAFTRYSLHVTEIGIPVMLLLACVPLWRPGWRALLVLVLVPALSLLILIGVSIIKPVLLTRTLAWLLLPLAVALGSILSRQYRVLAAGCVAAVAALTLVQAAHAPTLKDNWPALFAQIGKVDPGTAIVLASHSPPGALARYAPDWPHAVRLDDGSPPIPETTIMPRLFGVATITSAQLAAMIATGQPVWFLSRGAPSPRFLAGLPPPTKTVQSEPRPNPTLQALFWHINETQ